MLARKVKKFIQEKKLLEGNDRVVVAVSGGPDSLCLLHILYSLQEILKIQLIVAHLNHGFRKESEQEAGQVRAVAEELSLPFEGIFISVPGYMRGKGLSVQEAARKVRYDFLQRTAAKYQASKIAVGHHRDDQVETVLFNLIRGTGPDGLAGMRPGRPLGKFKLIRPLLKVDRQEIEDYCRKTGLKPVFDPSNEKTGYTRNRIRLELLPILERSYNPAIKEALERAASLASQDKEYLENVARVKFSAVAKKEGQAVIINRSLLRSMPAALQGRAARLALEEFLPRKRIGWRHVYLLLDLAEANGPSREISLPCGVSAYRTYDRITISAFEAPRVQDPGRRVLLKKPGNTLLPEGDLISARFCPPGELKWPPRDDQAYLDAALLKKDLEVCSRWPGARFHPQGASGSKKLKNFFVDQKIPRKKRDTIPLVTMGEEVIWVTGVRIAHPYRVTDKTKNVLVLEWGKSRTGNLER